MSELGLFHCDLACWRKTRFPTLLAAHDLRFSPAARDLDAFNRQLTNRREIVPARTWDPEAKGTLSGAGFRAPSVFLATTFAHP